MEDAMFQGMEYVYEVYKERSFSKAAQNLFISQPSLSANVKRVEARIGYPIFDRSTKPLGLTELGERYIRSVEQILSVESGFSDYVNDCGELKTGNLILGGSNLFSSWILPPMMARFARKYPSVKLVLMEERTARLQEHLLAGDVDIMIDYGLAGEEAFEKKLFRTERLVLAVPRAFENNRRMEAYRIRPEWIRSGYYLQDRVRNSADFRRSVQYRHVSLSKGADYGIQHVCRRYRPCARLVYV